MISIACTTCRNIKRKDGDGPPLDRSRDAER